MHWLSNKKVVIVDMIKKFILLLGLSQVGCTGNHVVPSSSPQVIKPSAQSLPTPSDANPIFSDSPARKAPPMHRLPPSPPGSTAVCLDPPECKAFRVDGGQPK